MASVTGSEIPEIAKFMQDIWKMIKEFWIPEDPDSKYWDEIVSRANELDQKYNHDDFCQGMILSLLDYTDWKQNCNRGLYNKPFATYLYERMGRKGKIAEHGKGSERTQA